MKTAFQGGYLQDIALARARHGINYLLTLIATVIAVTSQKLSLDGYLYYVQYTMVVRGLRQGFLM